MVQSAFLPVCTEISPGPASASAPARDPGGPLLIKGLLRPQLPVRSSTKTKRAKEISCLWSNWYHKGTWWPQKQSVVFVVWNVIPVVGMRVILSMQKSACGWTWGRLQTPACVSKKHWYPFLWGLLLDQRCHRRKTQTILTASELFPISLALGYPVAPALDTMPVYKRGPGVPASGLWCHLSATMVLSCQCQLHARYDSSA